MNRGDLIIALLGVLLGILVLATLAFVLQPPLFTITPVGVLMLTLSIAIYYFTRYKQAFILLLVSGLILFCGGFILIGVLLASTPAWTP